MELMKKKGIIYRWYWVSVIKFKGGFCKLKCRVIGIGFCNINNGSVFVNVQWDGFHGFLKVEEKEGM